MKIIFIENTVCKLGENANENWCMLDSAHPNDLFFHLSSFSSCYVILECGDVEGEISTIIIQVAAEICKAGTKYRNLKNLKVDYTPCGNVVKGEKVGEAVFKSQRKVKQIKV